MRPGCGEHSDPPRSPLEQLARRFLAPPSQGLRGLRMDEALERRQLDARPGASARGHVPTVPRLCPHPAHLRPSHIAATGCRSRPHGARMVSDGLRECGPQASNLRVARSSRAGRAKRDGHFWVVRVSSRPPTVLEVCPDEQVLGLPLGDDPFRCRRWPPSESAAIFAAENVRSALHDVVYAA